MSDGMQMDFSMKQLYCRAYVDDELAVPEVFKNFSNFYSWAVSVRIKALNAFPIWVHFLVWIVIIVAVGILAKVGGTWIGAFLR